MHSSEFLVDHTLNEPPLYMDDPIFQYRSCLQLHYDFSLAIFFKNPFYRHHLRLPPTVEMHVSMPSAISLTNGKISHIESNSEEFVWW